MTLAFPAANRDRPARPVGDAPAARVGAFRMTVNAPRDAGGQLEGRSGSEAGNGAVRERRGAVGAVGGVFLGPHARNEVVGIVVRHRGHRDDLARLRVHHDRGGAPC